MDLNTSPNTEKQEVEISAGFRPVDSCWMREFLFQLIRFNTKSFSSMASGHPLCSHMLFGPAQA